MCAASVAHHRVHSFDLELCLPLAWVALELPGHAHPDVSQPVGGAASLFPLDALSSAVRRNICTEPYLLRNLPIFGVISLGQIDSQKSDEQVRGHILRRCSPFSVGPATCCLLEGQTVPIRGL